LMLEFLDSGTNFFKNHPIKVVFLFYWLVVVFFAYLCLVSLYPIKVFEMVSIKFDEPVHAGKVATYKLHYKKYWAVPGTVSRQLVNSQIITFPDITVNSEVGEHTKGSYLEIPEYIKSGEHHMVWTVTYDISFPFYTRTLTYRYKSEPFFIY